MDRPAFIAAKNRIYYLTRIKAGGNGMSRLLLSFSLIFLTFGAPAQDFVFNHLTTRDGLASNFVKCLWQDKDGFLWIGTENGLQRYDGHNFISPYYGSASTILPAGPVHQIVGDNKGRMWLRMEHEVGIFDPKTFRYQKVTIRAKKPVPPDRETFISTDSKGAVFVLVRYVALLYLNEATLDFDEEQAPCRIPESWGISYVYDDAPSGLMWIGSAKGLAAYDRVKKVLYHQQYNPLHLALIDDPRLHHITTFYIDRRRRYWIGTWDKAQLFYCFDEKRQQFTADTAGLGRLADRGYYELHKFSEVADTIIMARGLNCFVMKDGGEFEHFHDRYVTTYSIECNRMDDALEDREKILWLATDNGLYNTMFSSSTSRHFVLDKSKGLANLSHMLQLPNGDLWLGTWGRGILPRTSDLQGLGKPLPEPPKNDGSYNLVWDIEEQKATGKIWVGYQGGRLGVYDMTRSSAAFLAPVPLENSTVRQVKEDAWGNMWLGTQSGKLFRYNKGAPLIDSSFRLVQSFKNIVSRIYIDTKNQIWVATHGKGVFVINSRTGAVTAAYAVNRSKIRLSSDYINDISQLNDSLYYLAGNELNIIDIKNNMVTYASKWNDQPVGNIYALQTDNDGQLWLSTTNGIFKYNYKKNFFIKYTQWDNLVSVSNEEYLLEKSAKLRNGNIIFAGNQNLVMFNPAHYRNTLVPPDVTIAGFRLFNRYLPVDSLLRLKKLEFNRDQNSITIDFTVLSFRQLDKLTYYYKLKGADKEWLKAAGRLQASYTLLPPGEYTFMVRAQNEEGVFSANITRLVLVIHPPFWRTWWFMLLVFISLCAFAYYLHRMRVGRLLHVERVRTRLARDLHDDMGSTLSTINILSNMAIRKIETDKATAKDYVVKISDSSARIMESMDDIVWSINPLNDSMRKITARMKEVAGNVLEAKDINYTFDIEENVKDLTFDMEWRREIFLIFKEAINNIVKYSKATEVNINMRLQKSCLLMQVADNGVGFNPKRQVGENRGNGVVNMEKRALAMRGKFNITSVEGKGTTVELQVPVRM